MKEFDDSSFPEPELPQPETLAEINRAFLMRLRSVALDHSVQEYETRMDEHHRARSNAQEVIEGTREFIPEIQEPIEEELAERALTRLFFAFSNPNNPDDMPTAAQIVDLLEGIREVPMTDTTFAERLDTIASFMYGFQQEEISGPWHPGTTSAERYERAYEQMARLTNEGGQTE